ncbi:MAG: murein biosynthesis protein MurJ, partial [Mycobacterium sp.]|nr:murein biosynthesis protein MurJ [Mycobacterium sp.]
AGLAIDGNPATAWSTDTYVDAQPFPKFKDGVGLLLQLPEPTSLSAVAIDLNSTGTVAQIRSSASPSPAKLTDTAELSPPTPLTPGHNVIPVKTAAPTTFVLVWITTLGTTGGKSHSDISEVSPQRAVRP